MPPRSDWQPQTEVVDDAWQPQTERTVVKEHTRSPRKKPGLGATLGGLAGGLVGKLGGYPVAVGGAAAGGAIGEGFQQALEQGALGGPGPPLAGAMIDPGLLGAAGAEQGAYEAAGGLLGKGLRAVGTPLMKAAVRNMNPEVAKTLVLEGINVSRKGLGKLMGQLGVSAGKTKDIIVQSGAKGNAYQTQDIAVGVLRKLAPEIANNPLAEQDKQLVVRLTKLFTKSHPAIMKPERLHAIKQQADAIAEPIYAAMGRKEPITAAMAMRYRWHKALSDYAREQLELIPGVAESNARTRSLIMAKEALEPVVRKSPSLAARIAGRAAAPALGAGIGAALPGSPEERVRHGVAGAVAGGVATSPYALSQAALIANNPLLQLLLRQGPRAIGAME